jgi:hypothetical protein
MADPIEFKQEALSSCLDPLDRLAVLYMTVPLVIFLAGWLEVWAALPLIACVAYALKPLTAALPIGGARMPITRLQLTVAVVAGCAWTLSGGTAHVVFANWDWHLRDAVLHDLVVGQWPVGYGVFDGAQSLLRAPIGYYLPAALVGKWAGLLAAHFAMAAWTALGATLFLLQVLSQTPSRIGIALTVAAVIVLFGGFDIIGNLLSIPHFMARWDVTTRLEWWAGKYQYSSMTTQLFWVPNHALGGWLTIGLLLRGQSGAPILPLLPLVVVAVALWSPLAALGIVPFVLWNLGAVMAREHSVIRLRPRAWVPVLMVGLVVAAYLTLDSSRIPRGWTVGNNGAGIGDIAIDLFRQGRFFLLEVGFVGFAILAIRRCSQIVLALSVLALLPLVSFGAANDFVMRVSIPSLTVLAIGACLALTRDTLSAGTRAKKAVLGCMLAVGAVMPFQEFARAAVLDSWPIDLRATLIGAACGQYLPHYVARLGEQPIEHIMRRPQPIPLGPEGLSACENPAITLMHERDLAKAKTRDGR